MIKIKAYIYVLKHNKREKLLLNEYRPAFCFDYERTSFFSGKIHLPKEGLNFGETKILEVSFIENTGVEQFIKLGATFTFNEGRYQIGEGQILEILQ